MNWQKKPALNIILMQSVLNYGVNRINVNFAKYFIYQIFILDEKSSRNYSSAY